jgi:hypothetical protein
MGTSAQNLFDAVKAGDFVTAASVLINAPIDLLGAILNGTPDLGGQGILTPSDFGTIFTVHGVLQSIAASLTGVPPATATAVGLAQPAAASNASGTAKTVTLKTPSVKAPATAVDTATTSAPTISSGPVTKPVKPVLTQPTTGVTNGNTVAAGSSAKPTGGQLSSTLTKITAGLTKSASQTVKTGTHK